MAKLVLCESDSLQMNADNFSGKIELKVERIHRGWFFPLRVVLSIDATSTGEMPS